MDLEPNEFLALKLMGWVKGYSHWLCKVNGEARAIVSLDRWNPDLDLGQALKCSIKLKQFGYKVNIQIAATCGIEIYRQNKRILSECCGEESKLPALISASIQKVLT